MISKFVNIIYVKDNYDYATLVVMKKMTRSLNEPGTKLFFSIVSTIINHFFRIETKANNY